ncbi:zinc finger protein [Malassezia yamatoensis]|uniref:Zinc finger protein n=1 Tax=Malassezia yamatoensis TaxID=253288 RepID=A0AAJ6CGF9_9BASI|nr:zinc finger protein [Malassezia yamatoensis]
MHTRVVAPSMRGYESDTVSESSRSLAKNPTQAPTSDIKIAPQTPSGNPNHSPTVFQCSGFGDCQMVFTRSEHLARHVRKHTGERPFQCHCTRSFSRLDNLRQHCQTVHSETPDRNDEVLRRLSVLHSNLAASAAKNQRSAAKLPPIEIRAGSESDASHDANHSQKKPSLTSPTSVAVSSLLSVNEPSSSSRRSSSDSSVSDNRYAFPSYQGTKRVSTEVAPPLTSVSSIVSSPQPLNWPHHYSSQPPGVRSSSSLPPLSDLFNKTHPTKKDIEPRFTSRTWPVNSMDPTMRPGMDERHRAWYSVPVHPLTNSGSDSSHSANYMGPSFCPSYSTNASPNRYTPTIQYDMPWTNLPKQHSAGPATPVSYEPSKTVLLPPNQQQSRFNLHEANHSFVGNTSMTSLDQSSSPCLLGAMTPMHDLHTSRPLKKSRSTLFPGNTSNFTPSSARKLSAHHLSADHPEDHIGRTPRDSSLLGLPQYLKSVGPESSKDSTSTHPTMETNRAYLDREARKAKWESPSNRHRETVNCRQADMRSISLSHPDQVPYRLGYYNMSRKRNIEEDAR